MKSKTAPNKQPLIQINNANTAEILTLISLFHARNRCSFPWRCSSDDLIIDIKDVETEINKPKDQWDRPRLKKCLKGIAAGGRGSELGWQVLLIWLIRRSIPVTKVGIEIQSALGALNKLCKAYASAQRNRVFYLICGQPRFCEKSCFWTPRISLKPRRLHRISRDRHHPGLRNCLQSVEAARKKRQPPHLER
jgi:hypothetical protein